MKEIIRYLECDKQILPKAAKRVLRKWDRESGDLDKAMWELSDAIDKVEG